MMKKNNKQKITADILIAEIVEYYPEVVDFLIEEYEFHCINCVLAGFETLEEGAQVHGITGSDFKNLINKLNSMAK